MDGGLLFFLSVAIKPRAWPSASCLRFAAELDQEPTAARRQQGQVGDIQAHGVHVADEVVVDPFQADRLGRQHLHDVVAGAVHVRVAENQQRAHRRAVDQTQRRLQDHDAGAFRSDQGLGDIEAVLRQQVRKVVPRNPAGDVRIARANLVGVLVPQRLELGVDFAAPAAAPDDAFKFVIGSLADLHARTVIEQDVQLLGVFVRLARHDRMDAARVVAEHAAERAMVVGRGVRPEGEFVLLGRAAQEIEHAARLHPRPLVVRGRVRGCLRMYFEKSRTTATLQHWPARLVPPPRPRTGAP